MRSDLRIEQLVEDHLVFTKKLTRNYVKKQRGYVDFSDAYTEALYGLLLAARSYEDDRGAKFSTYAAIRIQSRLNDWTRERMREDGYTRRSAKEGRKHIEFIYWPEIDGESYDPISEEKNPEELAIDNDRFVHVLTAPYTPNQLRAIVLRLEGKLHEEIAQELGVCQTRVSQLLRAATHCAKLHVEKAQANV